MNPLTQLPAPLLSWYRQNARPLPWRSDPTPYHVWLSEIMLQQTRVSAGLEYYRRFLEALPTIQALADCPEDRLMKLWQGLGYYNRARNLQKAAQIIMREHGGAFPSDFPSIRALPGVGDYTAGAIASIAFGQTEPAVDGNVLRVASRILDSHQDVTKPQTKREITGLVREAIPPEAPGDFNQALMELGALVCLPNGAPLCGSCPAKEFCAGHLAGTAGELPVKPAKKVRMIEERTVYLIAWQGRLALRRRPERGLLAGLWEYPNGPAPWDCPVEGRPHPVGTAKHVFSHIEWHMSGYAVEASGPELPEGWVWAGREELAAEYAVPSAFAGFQEAAEALLE